MVDDDEGGQKQPVKGRLKAQEGIPYPPSPPAPVETQRRVYALPADLVERIVEYQREKGYPSEVEAVRRLLDDALKSRDTLERIISRFLTRLGAQRSAVEVSRDILVGHPLVGSMSFEEDKVDFWMKDGWNVKISDDGTVLVWPPGEASKRGGLAWSWVPDDDKFGPGTITDDIPF
ncbi:hypothetical protein GCM10007989_04670 [Devosia pacifica]|uniref:Uncharacterized protein n=1 Tax=Devosia pacifica TaxID=1335967 RepID=A0A918RVW0_9HYPH|nr:hypothetical protein [Devosia pacifica]GHA13155.1 hypothetical protein GCM10007989_04670 [Devosia pacifica]